MTWPTADLNHPAEVSKRTDDMKVFVVPPPGRVVEQTSAWIDKHRRSAHDYETRPGRYEPRSGRCTIQWQGTPRSRRHQLSCVALRTRALVRPAG